MNARVNPAPARTGSPCGCGGASSKEDCAALDCRSDGYVRPKFFAGQLLTEDDLQALADYTTAKNRLHNRHLMGSGVVCGLLVKCQPCGGGKIVVQPGYALDCCGNDIVLECAKELDVNALVRDLRRSMLGGYDCGDPCAGHKPGGKGDEGQRDPKKDARQYCLYVRYCENEADPVAPYGTDEPCGSSACEASRLREGVRFELRCRKETEAPDDVAHRVLACVGDLTGSATLLKNFGALVSNPDAAAVATVKEDLLDRLDASPHLADCALRADVQSIALPAQGTTDIDAANKLLQGYMRLLRECICDAMNPPCTPCVDPGVLLACLEVKDCEVVDICNLERRYVLTAPAFRHWYGFLAERIGESLERWCCGELDVPEIEPSRPASEPTGTPQPAPAAAAMAASAPPTAEKGAFATREPGAAFDAAALVKERLKATMRSALRLSERDLANLHHMAGSLGELAGRGAFDRMVPGFALLRSLDLQSELSRLAVEGTRKNETVRRTLDALIEERMGQRLAELQAQGEKAVAAEVDRRVKELAVDGGRLERELSTRDQEIAALKRDLESLRRRFVQPKPKGTSE